MYILYFLYMEKILYQKLLCMAVIAEHKEKL